MRANEFVDTEVLYENQLSILTVRDGKKLLSTIGYAPTGRQTGSHEIWKNEEGQLFAIPVHGKELKNGISRSILRLLKDKGRKLEEIISIMEDYNADA